MAAMMSPTRFVPIFRAVLALVRAVAVALGVALVCAVGFIFLGAAARARALVPARAAGVARSLGAAGDPSQGGGQAGGSANSTALASATLEQCLTAVDPTARSATFNGQMSAVAGTHLMAMRILVEEQGAGEDAFHALSAASAGGWRRSEAGVKIYKYVRQFTDLPAPGSFRATVEFHWIGEKGTVIKRAARRTPVCVQPDERPKLVVARIQVTPVAGAAARANYDVVLRNEGRSAAGPFAVTLNINGVTQPPMNVAALGPAAKTPIQIQAPRCVPGSTIEVVLDPQHQVAEAPGGGESDTLPCPLAEASAAVARMR